MTGLGVILLAALLVYWVWRYPAPLLAEQIATGHRHLAAALGRALLRAVRGSQEPGEQPPLTIRLGRIVGLLCTVVGLVLVVLMAPWLLGAAVGSWALTAWALSDILNAPRPAPDTEPTDAAPGTDETQPTEETPDDPAPDPLVSLLWHLTGTAPGVHVSTLAATLYGSPKPPPAAADHARALLAELGLTPHPGVRGHRPGDIGGPTTPSTGITREELAAATGPRPAPLPWGVADAVAAINYAGHSPVATRSGPVATAVAAPPEPPQAAPPAGHAHYGGALIITPGADAGDRRTRLRRRP